MSEPTLPSALASDQNYLWSVERLQPWAKALPVSCVNYLQEITDPEKLLAAITIAVTDFSYVQKYFDDKSDLSTYDHMIVLASLCKQIGGIPSIAVKTQDQFKSISQAILNYPRLNVNNESYLLQTEHLAPVTFSSEEGSGDRMDMSANNTLHIHAINHSKPPNPNSLTGTDAKSFKIFTQTRIKIILPTFMPCVPTHTLLTKFMPEAIVELIGRAVNLLAFSGDETARKAVAQLTPSTFAAHHLVHAAFNHVTIMDKEAQNCLFELLANYTRLTSNYIKSQQEFVPLKDVFMKPIAILTGAIWAIQTCRELHSAKPQTHALRIPIQGLVDFDVIETDTNKIWRASKSGDNLQATSSHEAWHARLQSLLFLLPIDLANDNSQTSDTSIPRAIPVDHKIAIKYSNALSTGARVANLWLESASEPEERAFWALQHQAISAAALFVKKIAISVQYGHDKPLTSTILAAEPLILTPWVTYALGRLHSDYTNVIQSQKNSATVYPKFFNNHWRYHLPSGSQTQDWPDEFKTPGGQFVDNQYDMFCTPGKVRSQSELLFVYLHNNWPFVRDLVPTFTHHSSARALTQILETLDDTNLSHKENISFNHFLATQRNLAMRQSETGNATATKETYSAKRVNHRARL